MNKAGIWKEEGTATKQGNNYVGDVKHFSFWNCDYPFDAVSLSVTLQNDKKLFLTNVPVKISFSDTGSLIGSYGYTDSLGLVKGLVPANKSLLLEVLDPCGNTIYSKNISPLTTDTDLGVITVSNSSASLLTFSGTLLDCNGAPVKKGYSIINFNNIIRYAATDATGKYAATFIICSGTPPTASVLGVDETSQQQSTTSSVTVSSPVTDAGNITACGTSIEQFINYTLDDIDYTITSAANDSISGFTITGTPEKQTYIGGSKNPFGTNNLSIIIYNASASGTFPISSLNVQNYNNNILTQPFNITFTTFAEAAGEFYEGSFSGKFGDSTSASLHKISSTFRVRRNN